MVKLYKNVNKAIPPESSALDVSLITQKSPTQIHPWQILIFKEIQDGRRHIPQYIEIVITLIKINVETKIKVSNPTYMNVLVLLKLL